MQLPPYRPDYHGKGVSDSPNSQTEQFNNSFGLHGIYNLFGGMNQIILFKGEVFIIIAQNC